MATLVVTLFHSPISSKIRRCFASQNCMSKLHEVAQPSSSIGLKSNPLIPVISYETRLTILEE